MTELLLWGGIFIAALAVEFNTAALVSVWFAVGALAAYITSLFTDSFTTQLAVFTFVSVLSLILSAVFFKKKPFTRKTSTNSDLNVGRTALVSEEINLEKKTGRVVLDDVGWLAISDGIIPIDTPVIVAAVEGAKLRVYAK